MLLIAGGEQDPNIHSLAEAADLNEVEYSLLLVGSEHHPTIRWELDSDKLLLDDEAIRPGAVFVRHDVFGHLADPRPAVAARAAGWYTTIAAWALAHPDVVMLNRQSSGRLTNKPLQLVLARDCGLLVPFTVLSNDLDWVRKHYKESELVTKPVNGAGIAS